MKLAAADPVEFLESSPEGRSLPCRSVNTSMQLRNLSIGTIPAYGQSWDLREAFDRSRLAWLIVRVLKPRVIHLGTPCTAFSQIGRQSPSADDWSLVAFSVAVCEHQRRTYGFVSVENPASSNLWHTEMWQEAFGSPTQPQISVVLLPLRRLPARASAPCGGRRRSANVQASALDGELLARRRRATLPTSLAGACRRTPSAPPDPRKRSHSLGLGVLVCLQRTIPLSDVRRHSAGH